jgi:2-methylisocitrate lyase-like PEP mutase family enzyme
MRATLSRQFFALHQPGRPFVLPNAWDVASALLLADAGFPAVGTTSMGMTAAAGLVDGTGAGKACSLTLAAEVIRRLAVPVTVDLEGGYSEDPQEVADFAARLADLGAAGINLEDAALGGGLRPPAAHASIICAVTAAAPSLFVNARTDTYWQQAGVAGDRLAETITRLQAYADAGAHGGFVPLLTDPADVAAVAERVALPLNVLWRPGLDLGLMAEAGVARVSTGSAPYRRALAAGVATAVAAREGGSPPAPDVSYEQVLTLLRGGHSTPCSSA